MERSYVRGRGAKVSCALLDVLREAGVMGMSVGYLRKGVLLVRLDNAERDRPKVPAEFYGYKTQVEQDPNPAPPLSHMKVGAGCAHTRWELMQFKSKGIVPNQDCRESEYWPERETEIQTVTEKGSVQHLTSEGADGKTQTQTSRK